ncbi:MAG: MFS transporter [Anaerolineales bacterium]|nr:MFS transporter [Anaerolineales bacterium]
MTNLIERLTSFRKNAALTNTAVYYLMFIGLGLGMGAIGPTIPSLAAQTGSTLGALSRIFLAASIGYTCGTWLGGRLFDRLRGHPLLGAALLASGLLVFFIPLVPALWMLVVIVALKGLADGIINTGTNTLLVWTHRDKAAPFMNGLHFCFGLGAFLSPLLAAQVVDIENGYRWVFWILGAINVLVSLRLMTLRTNPSPAEPGRENDPASPGGRRALVPLVAVALLFLFFYVGAEITYGNWIYTYALSLGLTTASGAAYLNSAFWLAFTVGRLISIPMAMRFTPRQTIPLALAGCLVALTLLVSVPDAGWTVWTATIGLGFFMAPVWPSGYTLAGQSLHLTARLSSIILLGDSLGGMVLPWLVGQVIEESGPAIMAWLVLGSLVLNLLAYAGMLRLRPKPI